LNLNKPTDITSRDAVNRIQRLIRPVKCGHAGTLDPMATGVLLVCVGQATRMVSLLQELPKTYVSRFQLAVTSDTDDSSGKMTPANPPVVPLSEVEVRRALSAQTGIIPQVPPLYSAVHVDGQRAYRLARAGKTPVLKPKPVVIHELELMRYEWPYLDLRIVCGSGTYIRSIARDLGKDLGCGGLMTALRRTAIGGFNLETAVDPDFATVDAVASCVIPAVTIVSHLPQHRCSSAQADDVGTGKPIPLPEDLQTLTSDKPSDASAARIALLSHDGTQLLSLAEIRVRDGQQMLQPRCVFSKQ
jgi:tRNA pseudouridine55 synthase